MDGMGAYYDAVGRRVHEQGESLDDSDTVKAALIDVGLADRAGGLGRRTPTGLLPSTAGWASRRAASDADARARDGPAIFGPVTTEPPADDSEAVELFRHVVWLARYDGFAELKRERNRLPDLESVRRRAPDR